MAATGQESRSPALQPESFRIHRAAGLLSAPDVPRGVSGTLHSLRSPTRWVYPPRGMQVFEDKQAPILRAF